MGKQCIYLSLFCGAFLCLNYIPIIAQQQSPPSIQWERCYGGSNFDDAEQISLTKDGGYIVIGRSYSDDGEVTGHHGDTTTSDIWVVKIDGKGNIQWEKSLGGSEYDNGFSIFQTSDGGYIVGGDAEGTDGDVTGNHGGSDLWVVKLDSLGHIQWEKCYGGTNIENGCFIKPAKDGGYILAGESNSLDGEVTGLHGNGLSIDIWVVKIDSIGNLQWEKCYGGTYDDFGEDIIPTSDGGYIVAGVSNSKDDGDVTGHHGGNNNIPDYWIVKIDSIGKIQWEKSLGGSDFDMAQKILQTADGGYIVVGYSQSIDGDVTGNHGGKDYWIIKLDANGNIQWEKSYGGTGDDWAISISLTNDGGYVVAGESNSNDGDVTGNHGGSNDCWIIKLDSVGTLQWQKCYGGTGGDVAVSISPTSDNGYIFLGYTNSNDGDVTGNHSSNQNVDYWVVKLGPVNAALIAAQSALFDTLGCDSIELSTVQIKNTGIDTLHIDSVVITQDNEGFSLVPALVVPFVIPPGRDTTITIQFAPATPGAKTAVLVIKSDANNTPVLTLDLSGQKNPSKNITAATTLPNISDSVGDIIWIPVVVQSSPQTELNGVGYEMRLSYDGSILLPIAIQGGTIDTIGNGYIIFTTTNAADTVLIQFIIALGDTTGTALHLDTISWNGACSVTGVRTDGAVTLTGLCQQGGTRLFVDTSGTLTLAQNDPNPFTGETMITYHTIEDGQTKLYIMDVIGRHVADLADGPAKAGDYTVHFNGAILRTGMYYYILETPTRRLIRQMVVVR